MTVPLSRRRANARQGVARVDREQRVGLAQIEAEKVAEAKALSERVAERERTRVRLTRDDLAGMTHVRDEFGWHRVVRLNRTTVTVTTPYSWTDRIAIDQVLEARAIKEDQ